MAAMTPAQRRAAAKARKVAAQTPTEQPLWVPVHHPRPLTVKIPPARPRPLLLKGWKTALVEPDPQIGFLRAANGDLHPIHDPRALDVSEQIAEVERPNNWVNLGDYLDLAEMSTYRQEQTFAQTVQPAIDEGYRHAAVMSSLTSTANDDDDWLHEGNHDLRAAAYLVDNAKAAYGLRKADAQPGSWPALSVPSLLRLDELGVDYVDGYPATWRYLNSNIATTHGAVTTNALQWYATNEQVSTISGHTHHAGTIYRSRNTQNKKVDIVAHSPGCLCRVDGFVPGGGKHHGRNGTTGLPTRSWQDWQQGITIVRYVPGDGPFELEYVRIDEGVARHGGQQFKSRVKL